MRCKKCGVNISDSVDFCDNCGNAISSINSVLNNSKGKSNTKIIVFIAILVLITILFSGLMILKGNNIFYIFASKANNPIDLEIDLSKKDDDISDSAVLVPNTPKQTTLPAETAVITKAEETSLGESEPTAAVTLEPTPIENKISFLIDDIAFENGLRAGLKDYLADSVWISTGESIFNPLVEDDEDLVMEDVWQYTFDMSEKTVEIFCLTTIGAEQSDYFEISEEGDYVDTFHYFDTIDGEDYVWNTRLFVCGDFLYDVVLLDGNPVSHYRVFKVYP